MMPLSSEFKNTQVAPKCDLRKILKQNKKHFSRTTSVCCRGAVLFEVSFKSSSRKFLSISKILLGEFL